MLKIIQFTMPYNKIELIKYRSERAFTTAAEAKTALENGHLFNAENRIYYAVFYIVSALALIDDFSTSKHKQLLGWFNKSYIKSGEIPIKYGKIYHNAFTQRQESDYDDFIELDKEEVIQDFEDMLEFLNYLNDYISKKLYKK